MINKSSIGDYFTGLVILAHSIPSQLTDANGDNLQDDFMQTLRDASDELELGLEVNWDAEGEPADVAFIGRKALAAIRQDAEELAALTDGLNLKTGDDRHD